VTSILRPLVGASSSSSSASTPDQDSSDDYPKIHQEGGSAQDQSGKTIALWTFNVKFPRGTRFTFGTLTFTAGKDGDLKILPSGPAPEHLALALTSALGGSCSGLDPCAGFYIRTTKLIRGIPIVTSILRPLIRVSSSSSSHRPLIKIHLTTTPRLGLAPVGSPQKAVALSL
jgi:hypothetical protein